jgi:hypothetical protein
MGVPLCSRAIPTSRDSEQWSRGNQLAISPPFDPTHSRDGRSEVGHELLEPVGGLVDQNAGLLPPKKPAKWGDQIFLIPDPLKWRTARRRKVRRTDRLGRQVYLADAAHHRSDAANRISGRTTLLMTPLLVWQAAKPLGYTLTQVNGAPYEGRAADFERDFDYLILTICPGLSICGMRCLYLANPEPQYDNSAYERTACRAGHLDPSNRRNQVFCFDGSIPSAR